MEQCMSVWTIFVSTLSCLGKLDAKCRSVSYKIFRARAEFRINFDCTNRRIQLRTFRLIDLIGLWGRFSQNVFLTVNVNNLHKGDISVGVLSVLIVFWQNSCIVWDRGYKFACPGNSEFLNVADVHRQLTIKKISDFFVNWEIWAFWHISLQSSMFLTVNAHTGTIFGKAEGVLWWTECLGRSQGFPFTMIPSRIFQIMSFFRHPGLVKRDFF